MSKKKQKKDEAGVPEWVVTYGDMMSLLLCFFILLAAFSELKRDHEYQRVITAVKEAFGYSGGVGVLPVDDPPLRSMIQSLETLAVSQMKETKVSESNDQGISGKRTEVSRVHDGLKFTIGGALTFRPESAELLESAKPELMKIARLLAGRNNKIEIRGHAAKKPLSPGSEFKDLRDLSYYRAKAVADYLVTEGGLRPETLVIDARGDTEPITPRTYTPEEQAVNRRVEIIQTETLVEDLHPDPDYADEDYARGST
ncbi:MAG: flagellar motor protein MotB [Planctomycetota bacterium]|nr:flagellar motor protein MotB [Planctomycetota bacterium]